jgi:hypothetical protein
MASPLTMYVLLKQDAKSQLAAKQASTTFTEAISQQFDDLGMVHYAAMALVPNPVNENGKSVGNLAVLIVTDFDGSMNSYIAGFWKSVQIRNTITAVQSIALYPGPDIETLTQLENYVNDYNLTPVPPNQVWTNFYQAYDKTVRQITS